MVEKGHFAELSQLLEMLGDSQYNPKRQTLIFSATLTLVHQAPARILHKKHTKKIDKTAKLDLFVQKIGMRGKPKVIDLTRNEATVETLTETKIHCETDEKDLYLYYFLMQYPGRTLVFANSISCIKRLSGLLKVLDIMPLTLHACSIQELCRQAWKFRYSAFSICRAKWIRSWGKGIECSFDRAFRPLGSKGSYTLCL